MAPTMAPTTEPLTVNETWLPIYVTLGLTVFQIVVLLTIFECSRRIRYVEDVYDRRRLVWKSRVPPPLMQKRGLLHGFLGFEWCRLKISDSNYLQMAKDEYRQSLQQRRLEEEKRKQQQHPTRTNSRRNLDDVVIPNRNFRRTKANAVDKFLVQAEKECLEESPFFFPDTADTLDHGVEGTHNEDVVSLEAGDDECNESISSPTDNCTEIQSNAVESSFPTAADEGLQRPSVTQPEHQTTIEKQELSKTGLPLIPSLDPLDEDPSTSSQSPCVNTTPANETSLRVNREVAERGNEIQDHCAAGNTLRCDEDGWDDGVTRETSMDQNIDFMNEIFPTKSKISSERTSTKGTDTTSSLDNSSSAIQGSNGIIRKITSFPSPFKSRKVRFSPDGTAGSVDGTQLSSKKASGASFWTRRATDSNLSTTERSRHSTVRLSNGVTVGSAQAEDIVKTRYYTQDQYDWDVSIASAICNFIKKRLLKMREEGDDDSAIAKNEEPNLSSQSSAIQKKPMFSRNILHRPLSKEQAELLRCVGLDGFVLLQFLKFGFAISFWPMLFACIVLIPTYRSGSGEQIGFFSVTVTNIGDDSAKLWLVLIYGYIQILFVLRRMWVEWEIFLPLRNDFLEKGDFTHTKYQNQYRKSCLVEYVPKTHRHDATLYNFLDALFPGQVRRAEVLLNSEYLRDLIKERLRHIVAYENVYAKKVHQRAKYLREVDACSNGSIIYRGCRKIVRPRKPPEPKIVVKEMVDGMDYKNFLMPSQNEKVADSHTYFTLPYHHREISRLNKEIEDEFLRLAQAKRRHVEAYREGMIAKWLGLKYLIGRDSGRVHSLTAFVEFNSLTAKQQAIQCNLTGSNALLSIQPVPEVRDIVWENAHISRRLIDRRHVYANFAMIGFLILWSIIVALIRRVENISELLSVQNTLVASILDDYFPALVVEAMVRCIAFLLRYVAKWIRFKTISEIDTYVLMWYFTFRLFTFVFVIIGGSLVETGESFVDDPM